MVETEHPLRKTSFRKTKAKLSSLLRTRLVRAEEAGESIFCSTIHLRAASVGIPRKYPKTRKRQTQAAFTKAVKKANIDWDSSARKQRKETRSSACSLRFANLLFSSLPVLIFPVCRAFAFGATFSCDLNLREYVFAPAILRALTADFGVGFTRGNDTRNHYLSDV